MFVTKFQEEEKKFENKKHASAFLITAVLHGILLLLLLFTILRTPIPPFEDNAGGMGMEVNFGTSETGLGDEPSEVLQEEDATMQENASEPQQIAQNQENTEEILTQETEESEIVIKKEEPKKEVINKTPVKTTVEEPKTNPVKETPVKETPKVNERALFTGKKGNNNNPNNQGNAGGAGDQGKPNGTLDSKNYNGNGGSGNGNGQGNGIGDGIGNGNGPGIGYSLGGRKHTALPKPDENSQTTGIIVIRVKVDQKGNVVEASYQSKGSTSTNSGLINAAINAAKKAKFEADANALEFQLGSITYNFKVQ